MTPFITQLHHWALASDAANIVQRHQNFDALNNMASGVLGVIAFVLLTKQLYLLVRGGTPDFTTPLVRVGIAGIALHAIPWVGGIVADIAMGLHTYLMEGGQTGVFIRALDAVQSAEHCTDAPEITTGFNLEYISWLLSGGARIGLAMLMLEFSMSIAGVARLIVIDIIYPIIFNLVLYFGAISIPIGFLQGGDPVKKWLLNLISVASWPVTFAMLVTVMSSLTAGALGAIADGYTGLQCDMLVTALPEEVAPGGTISDIQNTVSLGSGLTTMVDANSMFIKQTIQMLAIIVVYCLILFFTPKISSLVVGAVSGSELGGMAMAKMISGARQAHQEAKSRKAQQAASGGGNPASVAQQVSSTVASSTQNAAAIKEARNSKGDNK